MGSDCEGEQWSTLCRGMPQQGRQGEVGGWYSSGTGHDHPHNHASSSKRGESGYPIARGILQLSSMALARLLTTG